MLGDVAVQTCQSTRSRDGLAHAICTRCTPHRHALRAHLRGAQRASPQGGQCSGLAEGAGL